MKTVMRRLIGRRAAIGMLIVLMSAPAICAEMRYPDFEAQWRNPTANRGGNPWDPNKPSSCGSGLNKPR